VWSFFRELSAGVRQQSEAFELALELPVENLLQLLKIK
jgi:hypothetical protein